MVDILLHLRQCLCVVSEISVHTPSESESEGGSQIKYEAVFLFDKWKSLETLTGHWLHKIFLAGYI